MDLHVFCKPNSQQAGVRIPVSLVLKASESNTSSGIYVDSAPIASDVNLQVFMLQGDALCYQGVRMSCMLCHRGHSVFSQRRGLQIPENAM